MSLMNSYLRSPNNSIESNEIQQLKQRLIELEKEDLLTNSIVHQEYLDIENRLKKLLENDRQ